MGQVVLPFTLTNGTTADASQVMANFSAGTAQINGNLDATNVTSAIPATQTGASNSAGAASTLMRSDAKFAIQGFQQLTSDPGSGNFVGRMYLNTSTGKVRYCTNTAGAGTWITVAPLAFSDLPTIANNTITSPMMATRSLASVTLTSDVTNIAGSGAYTDVLTGLSITCTGTQVVTLTGGISYLSTGGASPTVTWKVVDTTTSTDIAISANIVLGTNVGVEAADHRSIAFQTTLATGAHSLKLQASKNNGSVDIKGNAGPPYQTHLEAVVG